MDTTDHAVHIGSPAFVAGGARYDHQLIDRPKVLLCTLPRFQHLLEAGRPSINTNPPVGDVDVVAKVAGVAVPDELTASDQVGTEWNFWLVRLLTHGLVSPKNKDIHTERGGCQLI